MYRDNIENTLWLKRNSIKEKKDYLQKIMDYYNIKCNFTINYFGEYDIMFSYMNKKYKIQVDIDKMCWCLLEENVAGIRNKNRFHLIESFFGEDLLYKIIKFVKQRGKKDE